MRKKTFEIDILESDERYLKFYLMTIFRSKSDTFCAKMRKGD